MGVSKVVLGEETLIDLTSDSVNEESLLKGVTAHNASGEKIEGNVLVPTKISQLENDSGFLNNSSTVNFEQASERTNIESSEPIEIILGKIKKWFNDLKSHSFLNPVNNLLATVPGSSLDATQGKALDDKINALNDSLTTKTYNHVSQLDITSWFIPDIVKAMPVNSRFCCDTGQGVNAVSENKLPVNLGVLTIDKPTNSRQRVMFNYSAYNSIGQMYIASIDMVNLVVNDWYEIGTPSYTRDNVTPDGTYCTMGGGTANYWYVEKSGKQVNMYGRVYFPNKLTIDTWYNIGQLPEGYYPKHTHANMLFSAYRGMNIECSIDTTGVVQIRPQGTSVNGWFPIATTNWFTA